jgi:hypothetical protein
MKTSQHKVTNDDIDDAVFATALIFIRLAAVKMMLAKVNPEENVFVVHVVSGFTM